MPAAAGRPGLSKGRISAYLQCPRRLWLEVHGPPPLQADGSLRFVLAQGREAGRAARALYPEGIALDAEGDVRSALERTTELVAQHPGSALFEAAFAHQGVLVRTDLLLPERDGWVLAEVKSSSSPREHQLEDVAIQHWVARGAGLKLRRTELWHLNTGWTYAGDGDYRELFVRIALDAEVAARLPSIEQAVREARVTLAGDEPELSMGPQCRTPFVCPFQDHCGAGLGPAPEFPVTLLPHNKGKRLAQALLEDGYTDLREVPAARIVDPELAMIHRATRTGRPFIDPGLRQAMAAFAHPRSFLDFETIALAVPRWAGTRPYEPVPFQWSCHVQSADGGLRHAEFLDVSGADPRDACARALLEALPADGPILAYNAAFERGVIERLAKRSPVLATRLRAAAARLVDLHPLVREGYYHRDMLGSRSIKAVLPTLGIGLDHDDLEEVREGMGVQLAYLEAIDPATAPQRRAALERALRRYCALDTRGLVELVRFLSA